MRQGENGGLSSEPWEARSGEAEGVGVGGVGGAGTGVWAVDGVGSRPAQLLCQEGLSGPAGPQAAAIGGGFGGALLCALGSGGDVHLSEGLSQALTRVPSAVPSM